MQSATITPEIATAPTYGREPYIVAQAPATPGSVFTSEDRIHLGPFIDRYLCDADARTKNPDLTTMAGLADAQSLTAQARAAFPRVVIETVALDEGAPAMFRDLGNNVWRFAYDPAQWTRATAQAVIGMYIGGDLVEYTPAAYQALRHLDLPARRAEDPSPTSIAFWDSVEQAVITSYDPKAAVERIANLLTAEQANR